MTALRHHASRWLLSAIVVFAAGVRFYGLGHDLPYSPAVDEPAAANRVFELGSQPPLSMDEIIRTIMRILGKRKPLVHQPAWLVKIPAAVIQYVPNAPLSPGAVDFITMDERVDPTEAERVFGMPFRSLDAGLREYLR